MQLAEEYQKKIFGILRVLFPTAKLYLFGSRARGTASEFSDIDIAVDEGKKIEPIKIGEARDMFVESNIMYNIDVVDLQSVSEEMKKQIKKEGIQWTS